MDSQNGEKNGQNLDMFEDFQSWKIYVESTLPVDQESRKSLKDLSITFFDLLCNAKFYYAKFRDNYRWASNSNLESVKLVEFLNSFTETSKELIKPSFRSAQEISGFDFNEFNDNLLSLTKMFWVFLIDKDIKKLDNIFISNEFKQNKKIISDSYRKTDWIIELLNKKNTNIDLPFWATADKDKEMWIKYINNKDGDLFVSFGSRHEALKAADRIHASIKERLNKAINGGPVIANNELKFIVNIKQSNDSCKVIGLRTGNAIHDLFMRICN